MLAEELRRWIDSRRAGEARELAEKPDPSQRPDEIALALIALAARLHGWPLPEDTARRRDVTDARGQWARLRAALAGR
jgi:hypothetical protein